jgi:hypothetical protein
MPSKVDLELPCRVWVWAVLATTLTLSSCSEPEEPDPGGKLTQAQAQDFEGIYTLTGRTTNLSACEVGESSLATTSDTSFVLVSASFAGEQLLELVSCKADTCVEIAEKTKAQTIVGSEYRHSFTGATSSEILTGVMAWSGGDNGSGTCTERTYDDLVLTRSGDTLHFERTTKALQDAPAEDGFCFAELELEKKEAASAPCTEMETIDAKWSAALP